MTAESAEGEETHLIARPRRAARTRRHKIVRRILTGLSVVLLLAMGAGYWALDRFVIDHVQIGDVAAYEAQILATTTTTTPSVTSVSPATATSTSTSTASPRATSTSTLPVDPLITDTSYASDRFSITVSKVVTGQGDEQVTFFVADVQVNDATVLRGGFAENKFGTNIVANTSSIASFYDAVFAINGDYYGFRDSGIVIRNGVLFRDNGARTGLAMYTNGTMAVYDETTTTGEQLLADGVWNTVSFGPALVSNGKIVQGIEAVEVDTNFGNHSIQGNQPRTGLGMIAPNHFVFIVVDGRSKGYSRGVTMPEFAEMFREFGATVAYNLDGGGSATMWFNGAGREQPIG